MFKPFFLINFCDLSKRNWQRSLADSKYSMFALKHYQNGDAGRHNKNQYPSIQQIEFQKTSSKNIEIQSVAKCIQKLISTIYNMQIGYILNMLPLVFNIALSGYAASSIVLLAFPQLLYKKKNYKHPALQECLEDKKIMRIAHRGGTRKLIENTIAAFEKSEAYTDMLEMDVCETKDNTLVVHHDKTYARICGVDIKTTGLNLEQVPKIQEQIQQHFSQDILKIKSNGETIPTLQQVFQRFPSLPMNIQIKTPTVTSVKELQKLIHKYNRLDITLVGIAGNNPQMLQKHFPQGNRFISYGKIPKLLILYFTGLLPFCQIEQKAFQIPLYTKAYQAMKKRQIGDNMKTRLLFAALKIMNFLLVPLVWHLKKRGIMTYYWVCNTEEQYEKAIKLGGCGIMTDEAQLLDAYLSKKRQ